MASAGRFDKLWRRPQQLAAYGTKEFPSIRLERNTVASLSSTILQSTPLIAQVSCTDCAPLYPSHPSSSTRISPAVISILICLQLSSFATIGPNYPLEVKRETFLSGRHGSGKRIDILYVGLELRGLCIFHYRTLRQDIQIGRCEYPDRIHLSCHFCVAEFLNRRHRWLVV
ncbi:hypothetical protein P154DRAFT_574530 [Amniculicola lignicola CBS 123094]|uniref:Uncharacterized protein n=1 Tax=Amniculicola lignicola CBS 123094 TaxID=1392246 RepID=A0A6A5WJK6_9PLEO|nr:hypothetical protein P154DRAFT_574530 [Amniculicola lignicola CBS 123094]